MMTDTRKTPEALIEEMMVGTVDTMVSEKLGILAHQLEGLVKNMAPDDAARARVMLLKMMEKSAESFFNKMRLRLNKKDSPE